MAVTRVLGAQILLGHPIPFFGERLKVLCVHLHRFVAKRERGFTKRYTEFWPYLAQVMRSECTQILMGDFNMALFRVVPELRLLGVTITMIAWFPWKSSSDKESFKHKPMSDSCGIFIVGQAVNAELKTGVPHLHAMDSTGFFHAGPSEHYAAINATEDGPGKALTCYLHKADSPFDQLHPTLRYNVGGDRAEDGMVLRTREKRMCMQVWLAGGRYGGSHYPIVAFTRNGRRRTWEAIQRRKEKTTKVKQQSDQHNWTRSKQSWSSSSSNWQPWGGFGDGSSWKDSWDVSWEVWGAQDGWRSGRWQDSDPA
jgi:hypothetical protein